MSEKDNKSIPSFSDSNNWKNLGFFSAEDYLVFVFKKTEKITAALYLVSGLLKDEEPLKWELRDKGMDLISSSFTASGSTPGDKNSVIQSLFSASLETISLLNIARVSNLISEMNHRILVREIDAIITLLRDRLAANAENAGYVLSESFFRTASTSSDGSNTRSQIGRSSMIRDDKGQQDSVKAKKNERQVSILDILKTQSNLSVKDFAKVIKDCSEKTIQRELSVLVDSGVVKKEGERRWSRYSLK